MNKISDVLVRYHTKELEGQTERSVYDLFAWSKRDVLLKDHKSGAILTDMQDLDFPVHYSQNAVDIIASKYFRKAGVPGDTGCETSPAAIGAQNGGFLDLGLDARGHPHH